MSTIGITALTVSRHGGSEVLEVRPGRLADPAPGQLRVSVIASGVNFIDVYNREGVYPQDRPFTLGSEGCGHVEAIGPGVSGFEVGQVVAWALGSVGSHASATLVTAGQAVPVPADVAPETAAAVMLQGLTAHYLVNSTYLVQPGDSMLVHAAAGGVGQLLVQLGKNRGARVIATVGSAEKAAKAQALGADAVIRYDQVDDLAAAITEANAGHGVSVAYDGVGKSTFDASLASLATRGMLVLFGGASGQVPPFEIQRLNSGGSLFLTRPSLRHHIAARDELLWRATDVLQSVADGALTVEIGGRFALADAAQAYDELEGRRTTGKLILIP